MSITLMEYEVLAVKEKRSVVESLYNQLETISRGIINTDDVEVLKTLLAFLEAGGRLLEQKTIRKD